MNQPNRDTNRMRPIVLWGVMLLLCGVCRTALAQPSIAVLPTAPSSVAKLPYPAAAPPLNKPLHGFTAEIDTTYNGRSGYLPVRVTLQRVAAATSDTTVTVLLKARASRYRSRAETVVLQDIEIPASRISASVTISYPNIAPRQELMWEIYIEGSLAQELCGMDSFALNMSGLTIPRFLLLDGPDRQQRALDLVQSVYPMMNDTEAINLLNSKGSSRYYSYNHRSGYSNDADFSLEWLSAKQFPERVIDYSSLDVVYLHLDQLKLLQAEKPAWQALRHWLSAGGNIWITGAGAQWKHLAEIETAFGLTTSPAGNPADRGWESFSEDQLKSVQESVKGKLVDANDYLRVQAQQAQMTAQDAYDTSVEEEQQPLAEGTPPEPIENPQTEAEAEALVLAQFAAAMAKLPTPAIPDLLWQQVMLGRIRVFASERPFGPHGADGKPLPAPAQPAGVQPVPQPAQVVGPGQTGPPAVATATQATGASPQFTPLSRSPVEQILTPERELWESRHGVNCFAENPDFWNWLLPGVGLAPVGLFQILITLFVLVIGPLNYYVVRRLQRMYLLMITVPVSAGVVTLALFAYAFLSDGIGTRARIRSYTEIDPQAQLAVGWGRHSYYAGLAPSAGLQFPTDTLVLPFPAESLDNYSHRYTPDKNYEVQWGQQQYLKGDWLPSRTPTQYMTVQAAASTAKLKVSLQSGCQIENLLGVEIKQLVVVDSAGKYYFAEQIPAGSQATLTELASTSAVGMIAEGLNREPLEYPESLTASSSNWGSYGYSSYAGPLGATGRLEQALARIDDGEDHLPGSPFAPGRFVAIVDRSPLVAPGVAGAREEASLHVVAGRWSP